METIYVIAGLTRNPMSKIWRREIPGQARDDGAVRLSWFRGNSEIIGGDIRTAYTDIGAMLKFLRNKAAYTRRQIAGISAISARIKSARPLGGKGPGLRGGILIVP